MNAVHCRDFIPGWTFLFLLALVRPTMGDAETVVPPPSVPGHNPSDEHRRAAETFFERGTALYHELLYRDAAEAFGRAAEYWLHPQIQLYLSLALSRSGRPVAAYASLQKAVNLGVDRLSPADRQRARKLHDTLLREQLAIIEVRCDEPGASVRLDGEPLFVGPGSHTAPVVPASHVVTADKPGYFSARQSITLLPGHRGSIVIEMGPDTVIKRRHWAKWKPWAVVGAGVALGLAGAGVVWKSARDFDRAEVGRLCRDLLTAA